MKSKVIAVALIAASAMALGGCATRTQTNISSEVQMANPWTEYKTLEEAQEAAGVTIEIKDIDLSDAQYNVCAGVNLIEVNAEDLSIRKAIDDGDISGDYTEYKFEGTVKAGDIEAVIKGDSEDSIKVATWNKDKYAYSVTTEKGMTAEDVEAYVAEIN